MNGAVFFQGTWLCKGSEALELYEAAKKGDREGWVKLHAHLKQVNDAYERLIKKGEMN